MERCEEGSGKGVENPASVAWKGLIDRIRRKREKVYIESLEMLDGQFGGADMYM
jgi:hypothetical protein